MTCCPSWRMRWPATVPAMPPTCTSSPNMAFGDYDPALVVLRGARGVPRAHRDRHAVRRSARGRGPPPGMKTRRDLHITEIYPDHVVLDGNHPLAGMALRLAVSVCDVREATAEEIEAQSVSDSALSGVVDRATVAARALSFRASPRPARRASARAAGGPGLRRRQALRRQALASDSALAGRAETALAAPAGAESSTWRNAACTPPARSPAAPDRSSVRA